MKNQNEYQIFRREKKMNIYLLVDAMQARSE